MDHELPREPGPPSAPPTVVDAGFDVPPAPSTERRRWSAVGGYAGAAVAWGRARFLECDPTFWGALSMFALLAVVLYARWVATNFIFDEQEALLANPYVNAVQDLRFVDAIHRDFWGLPADRSIGSYRPIPNFIWRALWSLSSAKDGLFHRAFIHHIDNVLFHAANAAIVTGIVFSWTKRRGLAWLSGLLFVSCALLTEAVSGIVGIADVLGGMGALLALWALSTPAWAMPFGVFTAVVFGLFCKESALVCVPLIPFAALLVAPLTHPERPARFVRAALAFVGAAAAFYLYVELRKKWFLSPLPKELTEDLPEGAGSVQRLAHDFLVWFHQAPLPKDPLNNPLVDADRAHRIAGALRVYFRGLVQLVFPSPLSGDYSFPQEPVPERLVFPESVAGALAMVLPLIGSAVLFVVALFQERRGRLKAVAEGAGMRGDLLSALLRVFAVALLLLVPALALRSFLLEEPVHAALPDGGAGTALLVVPPAVGFCAWAWTAARSLGRARGRLGLRVAGLLLILAAVGLLATDLLILRARGIVLERRSLPLWLASAPIGILGIGLTIEGAPPIAPPDRRALGLSGVILVAVGITWVTVSYFPHSNIPVILPTVRAERFWYFPAIGSSLVLAVVFTWLHEVEARWHPARVVPWLVSAFVGFQCVQAYRHAMDYRSDLDFWRATKDAVPRSAKAHLNYSVMKGARGDLETRLVESKIAMKLAPEWAMAHIYTGDTLCRMHRAGEAWEYYKEGFALGPNDLSLIALALQCLYDEKELFAHEEELRAIGSAHRGSWVAWLGNDTLTNHEKHKGVDPKYRPRGYNDGPKE